MRVCLTEPRSALLASSLLASALAAFATLPAKAQAPAEFYAGKTITMIVSTGGGGAVDLNARLVAKHIAKYLPGSPAIVVRNMPGGGHTLATNFLYNQAPRDGTTIGTVINSMPLHQATGGQGVRFESTKFNWIGSTGVSNLTIMVWHTAGVTSVEDVKKREIVLGATGVGSGSYIYANALNILLGTRFRSSPAIRASSTSIWRSSAARCKAAAAQACPASSKSIRIG